MTLIATARRPRARPRPSLEERTVEHASSSRMVVKVARRAALLTLPVFVVLVLPGLSSVRDQFDHGRVGWVVAGIVLEILSCGCYVLLFRGVMGGSLSAAENVQVGLGEQGIAALLPAGGLGGLALGAVVLRRRGVDRKFVWRRTVAFFLLSSLANVVALLAVGLLLAAGVGGSPGAALTLLPAGAAIVSLVIVLALGRLRPAPNGRAGRAVGTFCGGIREAQTLMRSPSVIASTLGSWAFDNLVLWTAFLAYGRHVSLTIVAAAYLLGMLGNLVPLPGGFGGAEGGILGMLVLYGVGASTATAATLTYGLIALVVPGLLGMAALPFVERMLVRPSAPAVPLAPAYTLRS
ncbi:MAG TPA: flippase-like domain-containing protein [Solirubrobacteraceae bacterium]|jgi:uncharacterized membrane protein YbhN (UPF0104 family)|nr:flippase-like domain-containing protein [Solirubrobacteraceae bacterium]